ncbi:hypothetical protein THASP1DRAFT_31810 [Thamnocephalis sphaerospora]|uniref:BHLH domain-containing protein n=1 Tax=Thamnocephalis sphaerospora TaxID=78915 RepID=A0A4P9XKT9_9FUNG|nr:hypothetical protein THASP1DRAFT_31810 [Thamnocephalis sphaerospora]|eukprot:RKP06366.1 hypothetical protein THASP1DRAFT_31810 [Thamnocephalis sphaerospora]
MLLDAQQPYYAPTSVGSIDPSSKFPLDMANIGDNIHHHNNNGLAFRLANPTSYHLQQQQLHQQQQQRHPDTNGGDFGFSEAMSDMLSEAASSPDLGPQGLRGMHTIDPTLLQLGGLDKLSASPPIKNEMISPELHAMDLNQQRVAAAAAAMAANMAAASMGSPLLGVNAFDDDLSLGMGASPPTTSFLAMQQFGATTGHPFAAGLAAAMAANAHQAYQQQQQQQQPLQQDARHRSSSAGAASSSDELSVAMQDASSNFIGTSNASVPPMDMKVAGSGRYLRYAAGSTVGVPIAGAPAGASVIGGPTSGFQSMSMPIHLGMSTSAGNNAADWFGSATAAAATNGGLDVGSFPGMHSGAVPFGATAQNGVAGRAASDPNSGPGSATDMSMLNPMLDAEDIKGSHHQAQLLYEKRRRRRESHNAVERRRRDNINERIQELSTLLPDCVTDPNNKPNKGAVLRKSVDYIRHMQQMMQQYTRRNKELEAQLAQLQRERGLAGPDAGSLSMAASAPTSAAAAMAMAPMAMSLSMAAPGTPRATTTASVTADPTRVVMLTPVTTKSSILSGSSSSTKLLGH